MERFYYRDHHFANAVSMANYILECDKQDKAKIEKERQEKLKAEKQTRYEEVDKAYKEYEKIRDKFNTDYNNNYFVNRQISTSDFSELFESILGYKL